jgi:hypothetical protein
LDSQSIHHGEHCLQRQPAVFLSPMIAEHFHYKAHNQSVVKRKGVAMMTKMPTKSPSNSLPERHSTPYPPPCGDHCRPQFPITCA